MSKMFLKTNLYLKKIVVGVLLFFTVFLFSFVLVWFGFWCFFFLIKNTINMTKGISWNTLCEESVALSFSCWRSVVCTAYNFNYLGNSKKYFRIMIVAWWLFQASTDKLKLVLVVQGNKRKYTLLKLLLSQCQLPNCCASYFIFIKFFCSIFLLCRHFILFNFCLHYAIFVVIKQVHVLFFLSLMAMHCEEEGMRLFKWILYYFYLIWEQ